MKKEEYYKYWAKKHPENIKRAHQKYMQTEKGKNTHKKAQQKHYYKHRDKIILKHKEYLKTSKGAKALRRGQIKGMARDRRIINEFKKHGCAICGYDNCNPSLHFHHIEPKNKIFDFNISNMGLSDNRIITEFYKCILLCANCHGEIHAL